MNFRLLQRLTFFSSMVALITGFALLGKDREEKPLDMVFDKGPAVDVLSSGQYEYLSPIFFSIGITLLIISLFSYKIAKKAEWR